MKISHESRFDKQATFNGYGYATERMIDSLSRSRYEVKSNDPYSDVQMWFEQPQHWKWNDEKYKIGMLPWESTELLPGWADMMNKCDEIWTPSPLIARWYTDAGITPPIFVYEHGVDKIWEPKKRVVQDKFRFLHCGFEASRKGGSDVMNAFRSAFPSNQDVELVMKMVNTGWQIDSIGRVKLINKKVSVHEMVELFHSCHAYVYPSKGEGFGLTPLQAIATGMPTITVPAWAPYERFLDPELNLPAVLKKSPYPEIHPGKVFRISKDDLVDRMRFAYENYEKLHEQALNRTPKIAAEYDWDTLTFEAFGNLEKRLEK